MNINFTFDEVMESSCEGAHRIEFHGKEVLFLDKDGKEIGWFKCGLDSIEESS